MTLTRKIWISICGAGLICALAIGLHFRFRAHSRQLRAAHALQLQAEHGDSNAELELSRKYFSGTGVSQDYSQALLWAQKAADHGSANAAAAIGSWYYHGLGVSQNVSEAFHWYGVAAAEGDAAGEYALGYMYRHGLGTKQDDQEALGWIRKSAQQGYARAECELGYLYRKGDGVPQDYTQAAYWYRRAADQGDSEAESGIGFMEFYGYGVPQDRREAALWFHKAAEQGDEYARGALGIVWLGMTLRQLVFFVVQIACGLLLLISFFLPIQHRAKYRSKLAPWAGCLSWISAVIWWYGYNHYALRSSDRGLNAFTTSKFILDAIIIVLLVQVLRGEGSRRALN